MGTSTSLNRNAKPENGPPSFSSGHPEAEFNRLAEHLVNSDHLTDKQIEHALRVQPKLEPYRPLLQIVKELNYISAEQIADALRQHPVSIRIGELLVELGHISASDLNLALAIQAKESSRKKSVKSLSNAISSRSKHWCKGFLCS